MRFTPEKFAGDLAGAILVTALFTVIWDLAEQSDRGEWLLSIAVIPVLGSALGVVWNLLRTREKSDACPWGFAGSEPEAWKSVRLAMALAFLTDVSMIGVAALLRGDAFIALLGVGLGTVTAGAVFLSWSRSKSDLIQHGWRW